MIITQKELNIYEIENLHKKILSEIKKSKTSFTLNFTNVEKVDLNSIQLFLSLKKHCDEKKINLKFSNISTKQIKQLFKMFDLNTVLGVVK